MVSPSDQIGQYHEINPKVIRVAGEKHTAPDNSYKGHEQIGLTNSDPIKEDPTVPESYKTRIKEWLVAQVTYLDITEYFSKMNVWTFLGLIGVSRMVVYWIQRAL